MHAAELVRSHRELRLLAVTQKELFAAVELAGALVQITQEAAAHAVFGNHHFQATLNHALQRQRTHASQMLNLSHSQLGAQNSTHGAIFLPELQALAVKNIQRHIGH